VVLKESGSVAVGPSRTDVPASVVRLVTESCPGVGLVVDHDGLIVMVNAEVGRQFGYTQEELIGQSVDLLLPGSSPAAATADGGRAPADPETGRLGAGGDRHGRRRDGSEFPVEIRLRRIDDPTGRFVLASVVDVEDWRERAPDVPGAVDREFEFKRLVADLSMGFISLSSDQLSQSLNESLHKLGEALAVDRCAFFRIQEGEEPLVPLAQWHRPGIPPPPTVNLPTQSFPWALETLRAGRLLSFSTIAEIPSERDRAGYEALGTRSAVTVPTLMGGRILGALGFNMVTEERSWDANTVLDMRLVGALFGNVLARAENDEALRRALAQSERARDQLQATNVYLSREVQERLGIGRIVGDSPAIRRVLEQIEQVAATDATVLLLGETGVGKELLATLLHERSARRGRSMVRVNCAAIPATLIESELFGREKGAFTGALSKQIGRFEVADRSTLFLDEIGDLPADVQVKLLRVLEEKQIERLGSPRGIHVDVRIVAATHRNLEQRIIEGTFREDLFYRLNVFPVQVPPLRDRVEDIPVLVWRFVEEFSRTFGKRVEEIPRESMAALERHTWPGNIRELRNVVERAMIVATTPRLTIPLAVPLAGPGKRSLKLADVEKEHIRGVLESAGWRVRGKNGAAERLGLKPTTLETRMAKLGLSRPR
jgi:formate hydrogenlyase transcriptional activator